MVTIRRREPIAHSSEPLWRLYRFPNSLGALVEDDPSLATEGRIFSVRMVVFYGPAEGDFSFPADHIGQTHLCEEEVERYLDKLANRIEPGYWRQNNG